ncbi:MAG: lytic murein transglycosylase [Pseudomonadota bacterium]
MIFETARALALGALVSGGAAVLAPETAQARSACVTTQSFSDWKSAFRGQAAAAGVSDATLRQAYDPIRRDGDVIRRDRRQSFFALSFVDFSNRLVSTGRISAGQRMIDRRSGAFQAAEARYGVPAPVIAAFWALESDFGAGIKPENQHLIFDALATLAHDCRRPELFSEQLLAALRLVDTGRIPYARMVGSWAGEIGETQFLPSHVLNHGADGDGDGRVDLNGSDADIIFSTAAFIEHLGWRRGEPWLEEVRAPREMPWAEADLAIQHPVSAWRGWGVTRRDGAALRDGPPAALLLPMGRNGPAFLAYRNFQIYPEWNQSLNYAVTAAYLATRMAGAPAYSPGRGPVESFSFEEIKALQAALEARGLDTGGVDGKLGRKSRAAVKRAQIDLGLPADSYPSRELLNRLR